MINLTDKQKELLQSNNVKKNWTFEIYAGNAFVGYIPTSNMVDDSFTIKEALSTSETIEIGACEAATLTVQVADIPYNLKGRNLKVWLNAEDDEESITLPMGRFYVDECKNKNGTYFYDITAYDGMSLFDVDVSAWYRGLSFPVTVKTMRDSLCAYIGVEQENVTLPCDSVEIPEKISGFASTGRSVLKAICQINGCFGHFTRKGILTYVYLDNASTLTLKEGGVDCYQTSATHEESTAGEFDSVAVTPYDAMSVDDDNTVTYPEDSDCVNTLCMQSNFLTYGLSDETIAQIAKTVYEKIRNHPYVVHNTPTQGRVWQEVGDSITFEVESYGQTITFDTFILERTLLGFQAAADTYAAKGTETSDTLSALSAREMAIATSILSKTEVRANERELALREFNSIISSAIGLYEITETDENGAVKYYYANAATIKDATLVYTFNAGGFAWGTKDKGVDGLPETWSYGITNDGNAILNYLSVNKLTADYISVSNIVGAINNSSGDSELYITADHIKLESSYLTDSLDELSSRITQTANSITAEVTRAKGAEGELSSKLLLMEDEISAKVSETGGDDKSFSWSLTADGFFLKSNDTTVMGVTKNGLSVEGDIIATGGKIAGFTINTQCLTNSDGTSYIEISDSSGSYKTLLKSGSVGVMNSTTSSSGTTYTSGAYLGKNGLTVTYQTSANDSNLYINSYYQKRTNTTSYDGKNTTVYEGCITTKYGSYNVDNASETATGSFILGCARTVNKSPWQGVYEWGAYLRFDNYQSAYLCYDSSLSGAWKMKDVYTENEYGVSAPHVEASGTTTLYWRTGDHYNYYSSDGTVYHDGSYDCTYTVVACGELKLIFLEYIGSSDGAIAEDNWYYVQISALTTISQALGVSVVSAASSMTDLSGYKRSNEFVTLLNRNWVHFGMDNNSTRGFRAVVFCI